MILRDYQETISTDAAKLLEWFKIAYLSMQVRTGKTATALMAAQKYGATSVLFVTKKKAISSIKQQDDEDAKGDYDKMLHLLSFKLICINYEQLHNLSPDYNFDLVVLDEAHCIGQFPAPAERTRILKKLCDGKPVIYLSGTPTPESYSQLYHQFYVSSFSPFKEYKNFYAWAKDFVTVQKKYFYNRQINDYSNADKQKVDDHTKHLFISFSQEEAGFTQPVQEEIITVPMRRATYVLAEKLRKHRVFIGKNGEEVLADTAVKLMNKMHQVFSGTVITEQDDRIVFDTTKAEYIKEHFAGKKIAVFYKFQAELTMLILVFGSDSLCMDPQEFNACNNKIFVSQIQSGREGINLSTADCLIMLNIDFSALSYWQTRARLQSQERTKDAIVYWLFAENGIEPKIYAAVSKKKDFTLSYFKREYQIKSIELIK
jgi:hypothetical protein